MEDLNLKTPESSSSLSTLPVTIDNKLYWAVHAVWIVPAFTIAVASIRTMLQPDGAAPSVGVSLLASLLWIFLSFYPAWRNLLIDVIRLFLSRLQLIPLTLITIVYMAIGLSNSFGAFWGGVGISLCILTLIAAIISFSRDRRQLMFQLFLLVFISVVIIGIDVLLGTFILPDRSHNQIFVDHDPELGWKLRAGLSITRKDDLYIAKETVNSLGFRTDEIPFEKSHGLKRIVFLGDSNTESYTVSDKETYVYLIGKELSKYQPVEVVSLGIGGYSTDQEVLSYLIYGRKYDPDIVVLQFCSNDVEFNVLDSYWRGSKPLFERHGEMLILTGVPVPNLRNTGMFGAKLMQRSSTVLLIESLLRQLDVKRKVEKVGEEVNLEEAWKVTELLIRDLKSIVHSDGAKLVVFNADPHVGLTDSRLRKILKKHSIPYMETDKAYVDEFDSYWVSEHWNQKGQQAIADTLSPQLMKFF